MTLAGRRALVTGGGSGVGGVIAQRLADAGAEVTVCGRRPIDPPAGRLSAMVSSVLTVPQNLIDTSAAAVPPWPSATV